MKIDQEYLKKLLEAFEAAEGPVTDIRALQDAGLDYEDDAFVFHFELLNDQSLIAREDGKRGFGFTRGLSGHSSWVVTPLRLTAAGHEFLEALRDKEVWSTLKTSFKDASLATMVKVATTVLEAVVKTKVNKAMGIT